MEGDKIAEMLMNMSDASLDPCTHKYLKQWGSETTALQILEVLDMCIHGGLASGFVISALQHFYDFTLKRDGTTHDEVVKLATWRGEP